jgi:DNA-binding NtrC family response regulator
MPMLFTESEQAFAQAVARLAYGNPFLPERLEGERQALGEAFDPAGTLWQSPAEPEPAPNVVKIGERVAALMDTIRARLADGARPRRDENTLYEDLVLYGLYERHQAALYALARGADDAGRRVAAYASFRQDLGHYLELRGVRLSGAHEAPHLFAACYQVRRAFHHIYANILGESAPARQLRGPSGTGKELVAQAIGLARYIPFDAATERFAEPAGGAFVPLNLSALSPTLIESELFGHTRGAFTGALADRRGWFEGCPALGTVFLDEIGDVDLGIQVKLLRVLQTRTFQRLGETDDRQFAGKLVAATNRDLEALIAAGRFREDLYYRLCADLIETPPLAARLRDTPGELRTLCRVIAGRVVGESEADVVAADAEAWIHAHLGPAYPWPGNVRELEQCVRNLVIRGHYRPRRLPPTVDPRRVFADAVVRGALDADELLRRYATLVYAETGSVSETARRLGIDRTTARLKIDRVWLAALQAASGASRADAAVESAP